MNPSEEHADAELYEFVLEEVKVGNIDKGLMSKAIVKAEGDEKKGEALYVEWRVNILAEATLNEAAKLLAEKQKKESDKKLEPYRNWFKAFRKDMSSAKGGLFVFFALLALVCWILSLLVG